MTTVEDSSALLLQPVWSGIINYSPEVRHFVSHWLFASVASMAAFVLTCLYFTFLYDLPRYEKTKIQKDKWPTVKDMLEAAVPQLTTYFVLNTASWFLMPDRLELPELAPTLYQFLSELFWCFIIGDFCIYWSHRTMHAVPYLRHNIHSVHHKYTAVFSWAGGWVHPVEDAVVILCEVWYPLVAGVHPLTFWVYCVTWTVFLVEEHAGHDVWWSPSRWLPFAMGGGAAPHDLHHSPFTIKNFGFVFCVWDIMFGTFIPVGTEEKEASHKTIPRARPAIAQVLVTSFYEIGWGKNFHFAPLSKNLSFDDAVAQHQRDLSSALGLSAGSACLDIGSGVGGPMMQIAKTTGANIVGVNCNGFQNKRTVSNIQAAGLMRQCSAVQGDMVDLPFEAATFDAAYAIESTCYVEDKVRCYSEILRVLKEGQCFAMYDWVLTSKYNAKNPRHSAIKRGIESIGDIDILPDIPYASDMVDAIQQAGFEVLEHYDVAERARKHKDYIDWYVPFQGSLSFRGLVCSSTGRALTQLGMRGLEKMHIVPSGAADTHAMLCEGAKNIAAAGQAGIFSPMYFVLARKPVSSS